MIDFNFSRRPVCERMQNHIADIFLVNHMCHIAIAVYFYRVPGINPLSNISVTYLGEEEEEEEDCS